MHSCKKHVLDFCLVQKRIPLEMIFFLRNSYIYILYAIFINLKIFFSFDSIQVISIANTKKKIQKLVVIESQEEEKVCEIFFTFKTLISLYLISEQYKK